MKSTTDEMFEANTQWRQAQAEVVKVLRLAVKGNLVCPGSLCEELKALLRAEELSQTAMREVMAQVKADEASR